MTHQEVMRRVTRLVQALDWEIVCSLPPRPHSKVIHWTDKVRPKRHSPMMTVEEADDQAQA